MFTMYRLFGFTTIAIMIVVSIPFAATQDKKKAYGPKSMAQKVEGEKLTRAVMIDTTKKPMPKDDMVVVITAHSEGGDPNWADGGFSLTKAGDGRTIHVSGSLKHHVDAPLVGYGTTTTGKTWIYEIQGLKVDGSKVFVGISADYSGNELRTVFISLGVDAPTDATSFESAGWAVAGKREP